MADNEGRPINSIEAHMVMSGKARELRKYLEQRAIYSLENNHILDIARMTLDVLDAQTELIGAISREFRRDYSSVEHTHAGRVVIYAPNREEGT